jgi:FAD/FMN-containing dehydrogenase
MTIEALKAIVGPAGCTTDPHDLEPHLTEWRNTVRGKTELMLSPASTDEVAAILRHCNEYGIAVVPQGGNTGMCAAAVPDDSGDQVILNLRRMRAIRDIDAMNASISVDAGCVLADVQAAAAGAGLYFPLSLGAEGSCQIGGNLSTNAGGLNVLRYGTARNLVLGLEVVLADGRVLSGLRALRKDTAGYDLKQLFIGSEGTLGVITGASLKLFAPPGNTSTVLLALPSAETAVSLFGNLREVLNDGLEAFELISSRAMQLVERHIPQQRSPFDTEYPWYVLMETSGQRDVDALAELLEEQLGNGAILDAVLAKSGDEATKLWELRHTISLAEKTEGRGVKHDVSIPMSRLRQFLETAAERISAVEQEAELIVFGHIGDGNLHYNVHLPAANGKSDNEALREQISACIYDLVAELCGSFSAEHGVGLLKRDYLARYRDALDLELMRTLKQSLDPANILNPGKVI